MTRGSGQNGKAEVSRGSPGEANFSNLGGGWSTGRSPKERASIIRQNNIKLGTRIKQWHGRAAQGDPATSVVGCGAGAGVFDVGPLSLLTLLQIICVLALEWVAKPPVRELLTGKLTIP